MAVKKNSRTTKIPTPLISRIGEYFTELRPQPPLNTKSTLRCSAFSSLCSREEILCSKHKVDREQNTSSDLNLIFSHGTALHNILQNNVLPSLPDVLYGKWRCLRCGHVVGDQDVSEGKGVQAKIVPRPSTCEKCSKKYFQYEELSLWSDKYRISGHPDGFLKLSEYEGFGILEAKSISTQGAWEVKSAPKMDHVIQAQMYMWFTGTNWAQVLYWDKGTNGKSGLIEHHVERDDEVLESILESIDELWLKVKEVEETGVTELPERICADIKCPRAEVCSVAKQCFKEN